MTKEKEHKHTPVKIGDKYYCPQCHAELPMNQPCPTCKLEIDWKKV